MVRFVCEIVGFYNINCEANTNQDNLFCITQYLYHSPNATSEWSALILLLFVSVDLYKLQAKRDGRDAKNDNLRVGSMSPKISEVMSIWEKIL